MPLRIDRSCAKPRNRHLVSASGMVKVIRTTPLESEVNCGKKNAVSFRFLRAATLLKSGFGAEGCLAWATAPPPAPILSDTASPAAKLNCLIIIGAAPGAGEAIGGISASPSIIDVAASLLAPLRVAKATPFLA